MGFEVDYIRPSSIPLIRNLQSIYKFDFFVGSVHHVNTIPIDFDKQMYLRALESVGGTEEKLFEAYFDAQYEMLTRLRPAVVGHWDLIRLFSENPTRPLVEYGPGVWNRVERNVNFVLSYRGLTELNSASFRKGWDEPYPRRDLAEVGVIISFEAYVKGFLILFVISLSWPVVVDSPYPTIATPSHKLALIMIGSWATSEV